MSFWITTGVMTMAAVLLIIWPASRTVRGAGGRDAYELEIYRNQLTELDADERNGRIAADELAAARLEIQRRILATTNEPGSSRTTPPVSRRRLHRAASLVTVLVPAVTLAIYVALGRPGLPGSPHDESEQRLVAMFEGPLQTAPDNPDLLAAYGEALSVAAGGLVTARAEQLFLRVLEQAPQANVPRFYLGLAAYQSGNKEMALQRWIALEIDMPAGASRKTEVSRWIETAARETGADVTALRQAEQSRRAGSAVNNPRILAMVERLATRLESEPNDIEGWLRLGQSYMVLQRRRDAIEAYRQATRLAPDRIDAQLAFAEAMYTPETPESDLPEAFRKTIDRLLALAPDLPQTLYFGGVIAAVNGDTVKARALWNRLLMQTGLETPLGKLLQHRLGELGGQQADPADTDRRSVEDGKTATRP